VCPQPNPREEKQGGKEDRFNGKGASNLSILYM